MESDNSPMNVMVSCVRSTLSSTLGLSEWFIRIDLVLSLVLSKDTRSYLFPIFSYLLLSCPIYLTGAVSSVADFAIFGDRVLGPGGLSGAKNLDCAEGQDQPHDVQFTARRTRFFTIKGFYKWGVFMMINAG